ncbi:MAG: pseudouridine synthase [Neptuniibacter sp.]
MVSILLFNKPFQVLTQFTTDGDKSTLADFIDLPGYYAAGRLDYDSEGLLILTNEGPVQHYLANPKYKQVKTYWAQVEGAITDEAIHKLCKGVELKDGLTRPAQARVIPEPDIGPRHPPIRERKNIPTSWIELKITEGKNRQVRRMTAAVGFPTLRLVRYAIGDWTIDNLQPAESKLIEVDIRVPDAKKTGPRKGNGQNRMTANKFKSGLKKRLPKGSLKN